MFDSTKPTVQMLGRWQPWHDGHTELFKRALQKTGQVCIMVREMPISNSDPFTFPEVVTKIRDALQEKGYTYSEEFEIIKVPNIVDISYGRKVGYTITEHDLGEEIHKISATDIRKQESLHEFDSESIFMEFESDWARHYNNK